MGSGDMLFFVGFFFAFVGLGWIVWLLIRNHVLKRKEDVEEEETENQSQD